MKRLLIILWFLIAPSAWATNYYISPTGSDAANGLTTGTAWKTFAHAVPLLVADDTLNVMDGTWDGTGGTDFIHIHNDDGAANGSAGHPITIKAVNERQAVIYNTGHVNGIWAKGVSYWNIEGLWSRSQDVPPLEGADGYTFLGENSSHFQIKRCVFSHANRYNNNALFESLYFTDSLIEECEAYYFHRHAFSTADRNTFRRCYANSRGYADIPGGRVTEAYALDRGDTAWTTYPGRENIFENCISEGNGMGFDIQAAYGYTTPPTVSEYNQYLGCVSLNDRYGMTLSIREEANANHQPQNNTVTNCVVINPYYVGYYLRSTINTILTNCTTIASTTNSGFAADEPSGLQPVTSSVTFRNCLSVSNYDRGIYVEYGGSYPVDTWLVDYCNAYANYAPYYPATHANITNSTALNPNLDASKIYIPASSPMVGAGYGGADIGANIKYRYADGTITGTPLWASDSTFPHGAAITGLNDTAGNSCVNVHERLGTIPVIDITPPVISAISSGTPGTNGATITWTTDEGATSQVEYGLTEPAYGSFTAKSNDLVTSHSQNIGGLTGATTYHYRVISIDASSNSSTSADGTFKTGSPPDVPTSPSRMRLRRRYTDFYVDSSIADTYVASANPDFTTYNPATFSTSTGLAPVYKTIADVNASYPRPGDKIYFRKGQTWREQLTVPASGNAGLPITYGAFGSGAKPIIDGSNLITPGTLWTAASSTAIAEEQSTGEVAVNTRAANGSVEGQGFTSDTDITVPFIDTWTKKVGSPTGNAFLQIWATSGNRITGDNPLYQSDNIAINTISTSESWIRWFFSSPPTLSAGTLYVYILNGSYTLSDTATMTSSVNTSGGYRSGDPHCRHMYDADNSPPSFVGVVGGHDQTFRVYKTTTSTTIWTATVTTEPKVLFFDGTRGTLVASQADCTATGKWFWAANVLSVYSASDPDTAYTSPGIEVSARGTQLYVGSGISYVTVDSLHFRRGNGTTNVVDIEGPHITLKNCEICYGADSGLLLSGSAADTLIEDCLIHHHGEGGMYDCGVFTWKDAATAGHENIFRRNQVYNNWTYGMHFTSNYNIIEYNTVYDNGNTGQRGNGIEFINWDDDGYAQHNIARYNVVYGQKSGLDNGEGINADDFSDYTDIYYNIIYENDGPGITAWRSTHVNIYNNAIYGNCLNSGGALTSKYEIHIGASGAGEVSNINIKNNIARAMQGNTYAIGLDSKTYDSSGLSITNNLWYSSATNWYFWNATGGNNLATWNALTGVGTDLNSDPLFVSASDFHLQASSPCINAGVDVGLTTDYDGVTISGLPDIGAYEYVADDDSEQGHVFVWLWLMVACIIALPGIRWRG